MQKRKIKDLLYEQVSFVGKALSSPKRLELIEVLVQGEKSVDTLAREPVEPQDHADRRDISRRCKVRGSRRCVCWRPRLWGAE